MEFKEIDVNNVLNETLNNLNSKQRFIKSYNENYYLTEISYRIRLCRWLKFFNERYFNNPVLIKNTYYVLLEYCESNELFRTQTQNEFELSLLFYTKIMYCDFFITNDDEIIAKKMLTISLIYGKYPGMQTHSIADALKTLNGNKKREDITDFVTQLMVKFQPPLTILNNIELLDLKDIDILMFHLRGNNLKKYPELDFSVTNKELEIMLFQIPNLIKIQDNFIKKTAAIAKIIIATDNQRYITAFFNYSKIFNYRIDDFLNEISFWIKAYNLICETINPHANNGVTEYLDYIEHKKREHGKVYNLKGVTSESLDNAVNQWHQRGTNKTEPKLFDMTWIGTQIENFEIEYGGCNYQFSEIKDGKTLFKESNMMKHCVFSYINNCVNGICSIWSLKKNENTKFNNLLTIEIQNNEVIQVKGKHNRPATEFELGIVEYWANENSFIFII
jgi:hypothetical protein